MQRRSGVRNAALIVYAADMPQDILVEDFSDLTRTNGTTAFTDSETETLIASYQG